MIKIIARYTDYDNGIKPVAPAGKNKLDYIIKTFLNSGQEVELFSLCTVTSGIKKIKKNKQQIAEKFTINYITCFRKKTIIERIWHLIIDPCRVFFGLMSTIKKGETIYVYHSLSFQIVVSIIKMIKKCKLILEIEEIYGNVSNNKKTIKKEMRFFKYADAYVFPTFSLDKIVNIDKKPSVIIHGTYNVEKDYGESFNDDSIHCVYAGTFDSRKGGAAFAIKAAEFLKDNYHIHILGFGTEQDKQTIIKLINETQKKALCKLSFDGLKQGEEYIKFIQKCHIGLSTQNPNGIYNETSFPSKILSYMANGLRVVTIRIPVVEESAIGNSVWYFKTNDSKDIAQAIESIDILDAYDSRSIVRKLDKTFSREITKLIRYFDETSEKK